MLVDLESDIIITQVCYLKFTNAKLQIHISKGRQRLKEVEKDINTENLKGLFKQFVMKECVPQNTYEAYHPAEENYFTLFEDQSVMEQLTHVEIYIDTLEAYFGLLIDIQ